MWVKRAIFHCVAIAVIASPVIASADTIVWTGKEYIPLGVRIHDLTELVMPGPIATWWSEAPNRVTIKPVPGTDNVLTVRAASKNPSQRLFVRGKNGTIYVADVSRKLPYQPIVKVENAQSSFVAEARQAKKISPETLMRAMIKGQTMPGFSARKTNAVIMNTPPYRIVAKAIVQSPEMTGIIAQWQKDSLQPEVRFNPATFKISLPGAGKIRMISTNQWTLRSGQVATMYMVFTR
jgi:hypothetical protein